MMFGVITNGNWQGAMFHYSYLGNTLYMFVGAIITGVSWAVIDDRERYKTHKHLYITPMSGYAYLMGRGMAKLVIALISVAITIGFGVLVFKLPISLMSIHWPLLLASALLGVAALAALGLMLGAWTMMMARHMWSLGEAVAGGLFLFSGAIFPLDVLPIALRPIGFLFPVTYWLELSRRALLGSNAPAFNATFAHRSNAELLGILAGFTVVLLALSGYVYRRALHRAKEKGLMDLESAY
jgi:ABC-2 type transport system permease protein